LAAVLCCAGKGKALEFILKELKEAGAYPPDGVQVGDIITMRFMTAASAGTLAGMYRYLTCRRMPCVVSVTLLAMGGSGHVGDAE
jgi:hypothetical protein